MIDAKNGPMTSMGFLTIFGTWIFGVKTDWAIFVPKSFYFQLMALMAVKPANWAVQLINAAALETGSSCHAVAIAADEAGDMIKMLQTSEMTMDPMNGDPVTESSLSAS